MHLILNIYILKMCIYDIMKTHSCLLLCPTVIYKLHSSDQLTSTSCCLHITSLFIHSEVQLHVSCPLYLSSDSSRLWVLPPVGTAKNETQMQSLPSGPALQLQLKYYSVKNVTFLMTHFGKLPGELCVASESNV